MNRKKAAAEYGDFLIEMRNCFHTHSEISRKKYETSKRIKAELNRFGIAGRPCGLETGILATTQGAKSMIENGALDGVDGCFGIHVWLRHSGKYGWMKTH